MLEYALRYWVENNSTDEYERRLHKLIPDEGYIFVQKWLYPTCVQPTREQLNNIIANNALDLAKMKRIDYMEKRCETELDRESILETTVSDGQGGFVKIRTGRRHEQELNAKFDLNESKGIANSSVLDAKNNVIFLSNADIKKLRMDLIESKDAIYTNKIVKITAINEAATVEAVEAIEF